MTSQETALPIGAAWSGATRSSLEARKQSEMNSSLGYYPSIFNPHTTSKRGIVTVAKDRVPVGGNRAPVQQAIEKGARTLEEREGLPKGTGKGFGIYYEVHGNGKTKLVFLMGLDNSCFGWLPQVEHFIKDPSYSILVLDNRGYGNSDTPSGLYKTSELALDFIEVLEHLGPEWSGSRCVNIIGVSMGGMIALELAKMRPKIISSLTLISTTSGLGRGEKSFSTSLPPLSGVLGILGVLGGQMSNLDSDDSRIRRVCGVLFPKTWLAEKSLVEGCEGKTNGEVMFDMFKFRFSFTRPQTLSAALSQISSIATHRVSNEQLKVINEKIPKITVITGDVDYLVKPGNSDHLSNQMSRAEFVLFENAGHAINMQFSERLNQVLERTIEEGADRIQKEGW